MKKKIFGELLLMETLFLFLSMIVAIIYDEPNKTPFFVAMLAAGCTGAALYLPNRKLRKSIGRKDCYLIVSGVWVIFTLFGMLPFLLHGAVNSVVDAIFETLSGFTTTGATILCNIDEQPHSILFWRSTMQWMGGLGIMIFSIALLPTYNQNNTQLFSTETTTASFGKLRPKAKEAANGILLIYIALTFICSIFYFIGPMNLFDAICHAMTTVGTGGFSTHQESFAHWHSPYLEYVGALFMFLSGINFALYFLAVSKKWKPIQKNEELHWYAILTVTFVFLFFLMFMVNPSNSHSSQMPGSWESALRTALFHVTSIFSSSGFQGSHCDYLSWGAAFWIPTMLMMISGACAGSSTGGVKLIRIVLCIKGMLSEFVLLTHPNAVVPVKLSSHAIPLENFCRVLGFMFTFFVVLAAGIFLLGLTGMDFETSYGTALSTLCNAGPAWGNAGPLSSFAEVPAAGKWILSLLMLIGRLEIYTILMLFSVRFWRD